MWFSQDNKELQSARNRVEEYAEWLRLTLNSIGDGVITTDTDANITMINPIAARMMGVESENVIGLPHTQVFRIVNAYNGEPM